MNVLFFALCLGAFVCIASASDLIKNRSLNGKFAILLKNGSTTQVIEVKSRKVLMELEEVGRPYAEDSKITLVVASVIAFAAAPIISSRFAHTGKGKCPVRS